MSKGILLVFVVFSVMLAAISVNVHSQPATTLPSRQAASGRTYVGSATCGDCHVELYQRWSKTRMANVVSDPRGRPQAVLPDFTKADPLLTFKLDDVALTYGSKWKQRYFKRVGNDFYPLPAQYDVSHRIWRAYMVQPNADWCVRYYPADNMQRPTAPVCDRCHSVHLHIKTETAIEHH